MRGTLWGVPIIRIRIVYGVYFGSHYLGNLPYRVCGLCRVHVLRVWEFFGVAAGYQGPPAEVYATQNPSSFS